MSGVISHRNEQYGVIHRNEQYFGNVVACSGWRVMKEKELMLKKCAGDRSKTAHGLYCATVN